MYGQPPGLSHLAFVKCQMLLPLMSLRKKSSSLWCMGCLQSGNRCNAPTAMVSLLCWCMLWGIFGHGLASTGTCACIAGSGPDLFGPACPMFQQSLCTMARCIEAHIVTTTGYLLNPIAFQAAFDSSSPNPIDHIHVIPGCYGTGHVFCRLYSTSHMYYIYTHLGFFLEQNVTWPHVLPK